MRYVRFIESVSRAGRCFVPCPSKLNEQGRMKWLASIGQEIGGAERARQFAEGRGVSLILKSIDVAFKV